MVHQRINDIELHDEERAKSPEFTLSIRAVAERDHDAIHEILSSPTVIEGTMRVPHAAGRETAERLTPRSGTIHLVADMTAAQSVCSSWSRGPTSPVIDMSARSTSSQSTRTGQAGVRGGR